MAEIGSGYGSECHMLRYLGRHRELLNRHVRAEIPAESIDWLDFPFDARRIWRDGEWKGLDFLARESPARRAWSQLWPSRGNPPNWDAIGQAAIGGKREWILVEAKANVEELRSTCGAKPTGGLEKIRATLESTRDRIGASSEADWLEPYYQYCNRLCVLDTLLCNGEPARLLFIYFTGDLGGRGRTCPQDREGWRNALAGMKETIGLSARHQLSDRVHELFVSVCPTQ